MALHSREHLDAIREKSVSHWKRQMAAKAAERESLAKSNAGLVAAARAERDSGKPLVVESLEAKLEKAIPGARVVGGRPCDDPSKPWAVWDSRRRLSVAHSKRDAVDKAIALWGAR